MGVSPISDMLGVALVVRKLGIERKYVFGYALDLGCG